MSESTHSMADARGAGAPPEFASQPGEGSLPASEALARLGDIYAALPEVRCARAGDCCRMPGRTVRVFPVEWLAMRRAARDTLSKDQWQSIRATTRRGNMVRRLAGAPIDEAGGTHVPVVGEPRCFFYDDRGGACRIYNARPFPCREFGFVRAVDCGRVRLANQPDAHPSEAFDEAEVAALLEALREIPFSLVLQDGAAAPGRELMEFWLLFDGGIADDVLQREDLVDRYLVVLRLSARARRGNSAARADLETIAESGGPTISHLAARTIKTLGNPARPQPDSPETTAKP